MKFIISRGFKENSFLYGHVRGISISRNALYREYDILGWRCISSSRQPLDRIRQMDSRRFLSIDPRENEWLVSCFGRQGELIRIFNRMH